MKWLSNAADFPERNGGESGICVTGVGARSGFSAW